MNKPLSTQDVDEPQGCGSTPCAGYIPNELQPSQSSGVAGSDGSVKPHDCGASSLVLSVFPGIGLLDRAFEDEGFCVVRGPDLLWGGDIKRFHVPSGHFDGVIGGPPCQAHSPMANIARARGFKIAPDMIPEFERCVAEASPKWFLMENVPTAPAPSVVGYLVHSQLLNNRWLGEDQHRVRRISFGTRAGRKLHVQISALESTKYEPAVMATRRCQVAIKMGGSGKVKSTFKTMRDYGRRRFHDCLRLQGLPADFLAGSPLTVEGKQRVVGNGVPLPMGRAIARGIKSALADAAGLHGEAA